MGLKSLVLIMLAGLFAGSVVYLAASNIKVSQVNAIADDLVSQKFGPTPVIGDPKDQSLVPIGPPLCDFEDEWFYARFRDQITGLYGRCAPGYPDSFQKFIIDPTFVGKSVHFAEFGPPICENGKFRPYNTNNCIELL